MKLKLLPADSLALSSGHPGLTETAVWEEWKAKGIEKADVIVKNLKQSLPDQGLLEYTFPVLSVLSFSVHRSNIRGGYY